MADIRFTEISVWKASFPLRLTFSHNLATRDRIETLFAAIRTDTGAQGYGQALPRPYLTGETLESALDDIRGRWWPELARLRIPPGDIASCMRALEPLFAAADSRRRNASYAAVEMAALDAYARASSIPVAFAGATPARAIPLVGVISAGSPKKAFWIAKALRWLGYRRFKVKVGADAARDEELLAAVRKAVGGDAWLAADANAAWTWEEASARMERLRRFGVDLVEEPLTREASSGADFALLERKTGMAIMADESLCTLADADSLAARGSPSWWNLRLAKNGGFTGVGKLCAMARERGIHVYGGILVGESSLLAAAGKALFPGIAECAEYGFPRFFLKGDPFRGGPGGFGGAMRRAGGGKKGLGVCPISGSLNVLGENWWRSGAKT